MRAKNRRFAWILTLLLVFTCVFSLAIFTACRKDEKAALSVTSVEKTATEGNVDVYTMSFSDGSDFTFRITNGASGTDGVNGTNGANAYELYKKYNPDYAGSEETWLNDLVHGRLDSNYIENSTCLVTLTVKDGEGNPVKDVLVQQIGGYAYLTNAEGIINALVGEGAQEFNFCKVGYKTVAKSFTAQEIAAAGKKLTAEVTLEALPTADGYVLRRDNPLYLSALCRENTSYTYWYFDYEETGIRVTVDAVDDEIFTGSSSVGMNDNIEFIMQKNTTDTGWSIGNSIDVLVTFGAEGEWARFAASSTAFGENQYDRYVSEGKISVEKLPRYENTDGWSGVSVSVFLQYDLWGASASGAIGNMTIIPSTRNGDYYGNSVHRYYVENDTRWGQANTAARIEADGTAVNNYYELADLEALLQKSSAVHEGKTLNGNMAVVSSTGMVREFKENAQLFTDRTFMVHEDGLPSALDGTSFYRNSIVKTYDYEVVQEGYVVVGVPSGSPSNGGMLNEKGFVRLESNQPSISYVADSPSYMADTMSYFVKWCAEGETFTQERWSLVFFAPQEEYDAEFWMAQSATVTVLDTEEKVAQYAPSTRLWHGISNSFTVIEKEDGTQRLFAGFMSGGTREPDTGNCALVYYSDNGGDNWYPVIRVAFPDGTPDARVFDPIFEVTEDGELEIWWSQTNYAMSCMSMWYATVNGSTGAPSEMRVTDPQTIPDFEGMRNNKIAKLSTGEWLFSSWTFTERSSSTRVYSSLDRGQTWTKKAEVPAPGSWTIQESVITEARNPDGEIEKLILWIRCDGSTYTTLVSYSYDVGATWTKATEWCLPSPASRMYATTLASGNILLAHHYETTERKNVSVSLSTDGGVTFPHRLVLDTCKETSYPDIAIGTDGTIYAYWDCNRYVQSQVFMTALTERELLNIDGVAVLDRARIKTVASLDLTDRRSDITFNVSGEAGAAIEGATVTASTPWGSVTAEEMQAGTYFFENVTAELYEISVIKGDVLLYRTTLTKDEWLDSEFNGLVYNVTVTTGTVSGKVTDEITGEALQEATVTLGGVSAATDESGAFELTGVSLSASTLTVGKAGYRGITQTVAVTEEGTVIESAIELLPAKTARLGGFGGGTTTNGEHYVRYDMTYLIRTERGIRLYAKTGDTINRDSNALDKVVVELQTHEMGTTRQSQSLEFQFFGHGLIRIYDWQNNALKPLADATASATVAGCSATTVTVLEHGVDAFIPYDVMQYAIDVDHSEKGYVIDENTAIAISLVCARKRGGTTWEMASFWTYEDIPDLYGVGANGNISYTNPSQYAIVTPDGRVAKQANYLPDTIRTLEEFDERLKTLPVYREDTSLFTDMGGYDASSGLVFKTAERNAYACSDRTTHKFAGTIPAIEGMTYVYDGVLAPSAVKVGKAGYFLMIAGTDQTVGSQWTQLAQVSNPGYITNALFHAYVAWAEKDTILNVPAAGLIFTNEMVREATGRGILVFGDSYTDTNKFWKNWETSMAPYGAVSIGVSGAKVTDWLPRAERGEIAAYNPEKILINIGVNDINGRATGRETAANIIKLLNILHEQLPETEIYYSLIVPNNNYLQFESEYRRSNERVMQWVNSLGENGKVHVIDYSAGLYTTSRGIAVLNTAMFVDNLHLSAQGYAVWTDAIHKAMKIGAYAE